MISRRIVLLAAALVSTALCAMPTQEELSKAGLLIQELMKADLNALRNGKKTREQVGDAAVALAKEAQAPSEKYILLTGAFDHYMRSGSYDKAASALKAVRKAIPDWKGSDEFALIEKSMRYLASGKGGPVRERYEELKERQQYALKLKKALEQAKAKPADKKLQLQVAAYYAVLDHWPQAIDAFLAGSNPACAAAAKLEKESASPGQIADAWWSASDVKPDFLSRALRAHAADLYSKVLEDKSFTGLQKVVAERRVKEVLSELSGITESSDDSSAATVVGNAKYFGVELIGGSVKENRGVLSGFANGSYAKIRAPFDPKNKPIEAVVEFEASAKDDSLTGVLSSSIKYGFAPVYIKGGQVIGNLSSDGVSWNLVRGEAIGIAVDVKKTYRVKVIWDGKAYTWYLWEKNKWLTLWQIQCVTPVFCGADLVIGTNRTLTHPFAGTIDLNRCYICIDGKLWWEGVKGAHRNANH